MHSRIYTSSQHRHNKGLEHFMNSYASPKHSYTRHQERQDYYSPNLEQKYPISHSHASPKMAPRPLLSSHMSPSSEQNINNDPIEITQLHLTINQLRNSLQLSNQNGQRLQQQLFQQRKRNYELTEGKRRLEDQLERIQFELDRMGKYEALEERQVSVKLETALRQNARLNQQVSDMLDESKGLKQEQRKLMTQVDKLLRERASLANENQTLSYKLKQLEGDVNEVKKELQFQSNNSQNHLLQGNVQSHILQGQTYRSQRVPTVINSASSIPLNPLQEVEQVDYQAQSQKLLGDYQKLLVENESMKRLYSEFYKGGDKNHRQQSIFKQNQSHNYKINISSDEANGPFSNKHIAERLSSDRKQQNDASQSPMFQTLQKQELRKELERLRAEAVVEVKESYQQAVKKAEKEKKNALKLFMAQILKNQNALGKIAQNYLELRATIKEEAGIELPSQPEGLSGDSLLVYQMYRSVKDKAKGQGTSGLAVAVFRLLTLIFRCQNMPIVLQDNMEHSILKYIYKLSNHSKQG